MITDSAFSNLSSHLHLEFYGGTPAEKFAEKYQISTPMVAVLSQEKAKGYYFFPEYPESEREKNIFLKQYKARKDHNIWTLYFSSDHYKDILSINVFHDMPSVIIENVKFINGHHFVHARFSNKFMKEISDRVVGLVAAGDTFRIIDYGENPGFDYLLSNRISGKERNLKVVRVAIDDYESEIYNGFSIPPNTVREFKSYREDSDLTGIYYFPDDMKDQPPQDFKKISDEKNYYEGPIRSQILSFLSSYGKNIPLLTFSRVHEFHKNKLIIEFIIYDWTMSILLERVKESREKFPKMSIYLESASYLGDISRLP